MNQHAVLFTLFTVLGGERQLNFSLKNFVLFVDKYQGKRGNSPYQIEN